MASALALLITYNQKEYVREAAMDLLAQDIPQLKVVFSDDASTDGTFEVLLEIASSYRGDKHVVARRNHRNLGMNAHINLLVSQSTEDILIPFAGDDRFQPNRARSLISALEDGSALLAFSDYDCIDKQGKPVPQDHSDATFFSDTSAELAAVSEALFVGAAAAWRRQLFEKYGMLPDSRAYEDLVLGFRAALEQGVVHVPEKLVSYRVGVGRSYLDQQADVDFSSPATRLYVAERSRDVMRARLNDCATYGLHDSDPIVLQIMQTYQAKTEEILRLVSTSTRPRSDSTLREKLRLIDNLEGNRVQARNELERAPRNGKGFNNCEPRAVRDVLQILTGVAFRGLLGRVILRAVKAEVRRQNIVDEEWYLEKYTDVREAGQGAIEHYLRHGVVEGRSPSKDSKH